MDWGDLLSALAVAAAIAAAWVVVLWLISVARRDVSIIDAVFSLVLLSIVGISGVAMGSAPGVRKWLLFGLMIVWSARITAYLGWRKWGEGEDPRYTKLRGWVEPGWPFHRFVLRQVFGLQGLTMFLLSLPAVISLTADEPRSLGFAAVVGTPIWAIGFVFETVGDLQLVRFQSNPANVGKVLDVGLWRYTAHPNYFGEVTMAWGLFVVVLDVPWAALGVLGPLAYTRLILRVTGTPTLEKKLRRTRPGYDEYLQRTSSFWPRRPRHLDGDAHR